MKKQFTLVMITVHFALFGQTNITGSITQNTTWDISGSPYKILSNINIESGSTLNIEEGVEVQFFNFTRMQVKGSIRASGSSQDPIKFTSLASGGTWYGIKIDTSTSSKLQFCQFSNVGNFYPALEINYVSNDTISNLEISGGHSGILIQNSSNIYFENNIILDLYSTDNYGTLTYGLKIDNCNNVYLTGNTFKSNYLRSSGCSPLIIQNCENKINVINNIFKGNNASGNDGGTGAINWRCNNDTLNVVNNTFDDNQGSGGYGGASGCIKICNYNGWGNSANQHYGFFSENKFKNHSGKEVVNIGRESFSSTSGHNIVFHQNEFTDNNKVAYIHVDSYGASSTDTIVFESNIIKNNDNGIHVSRGRVYIRENNFKNNSGTNSSNPTNQFVGSIVVGRSAYSYPDVFISKNYFQNDNISIRSSEDYYTGSLPNSCEIIANSFKNTIYSIVSDNNVLDIKYNNFDDVLDYFIYYHSTTSNLTVDSNYFGNRNFDTITFDFFDNSSFGLVSYSNNLSSPSTKSPLPIPNNPWYFSTQNNIYVNYDTINDPRVDSVAISGIQLTSLHLSDYPLILPLSTDIDSSFLQSYSNGKLSFKSDKIRNIFDLSISKNICFGDSVRIELSKTPNYASGRVLSVTIHESSDTIFNATQLLFSGDNLIVGYLSDTLFDNIEYLVDIRVDTIFNSRDTIKLLKQNSYTISHSGDIASCPMVQQTLQSPSGLSNVTWFSKQSYNTWGGFTMENNGSSIAASGGVSYYFTAMSQEGCVNYSDTLDLMIVGLSGNPPSISSSVPTTYCEGAPFNLTCSIPTNHISLNNYKGGVSPLSAMWFRNDTLVDSITFDHQMANTFSLTDSVPGTYKLRIGSGSCYEESTLIMTALPNVDLTVSSVANNTCYGDSQGSIIVNSQTANNFTWTSNQISSLPNNNTASNLPAGVYELTVSRSNGCSKSRQFNITEPPQISISSITESTSCHGDSDGAIFLSVSNAVQPYAISWAGIGSSNDTLELLPAGTYIATVVDSNNCSRSDSILVTQPDVISIQLLSSNNVNCYQGQDGSATVSISGGNGGYVSSWKEVGASSILSSTTTLSNVQAGVYRCTVVDSKGCTDSLDVTITQPLSALNASISSKTDILCNGDSTGSIIAQATGGTIGSGYSYLWTNNSNSVVSASSLASGLSAGIYNCQVTDVNGCTNSITDTILEPLAPVDIASSGVSNVLCYGGNDGSLWVTPSGGVAPYTYSWNTLGTNDTIDNLAAGSYSVIVSDNNGCTKNQSFVVTQPTVLTNSVTQSIYSGNTNISCPGGTDGYINLLPAGGTSPYSYSWSNLDTSQNITGLSAGSYTCTVTDANNCTSLANVSMTDPQDFVWSSSITDVSCNGLDDGAISLGISGGNQPYIIDWTSSPTSQGQVEVTFRLDMSQQSSFNTSSVSNVVQGFTAPLVMSDLYNDSIFILSHKFNPGDTIYWRFFNGSIAEIVPPACGVNTAQSIFERFLIVPSNDTILPVVCFSSCQNCQGTIGSGLSGSIQNSSKSLSDISAGIYTFNLLDRNGCSTVYVDTVVEPAPLVLTVDSIIDASCPQNVDGFVAVSVTGGSGNYVFDWSNGDTTQNVVVGYGYHSLIVTDANGCQDSATYLVDAPFPYNDEEICVVTVDSTGVNMIVWEKTPGQRTSEYILLRENASTQYTSVGTNVFNNMSTYADQNSNPSVQPYRYKLVLQDSCGNYSDTSDYHSTIHLQASPGVAANEVQLSWTAYEGKAVQTYYIYRWLSPLNRILIDSVSSNVFTYTDIYPVTTTITALLYEVGAKFVNGGCSPTAGKQATYANSMSNILDWGTDGGVSIGTDEWVDVVLEQDLEIYPNPTLGRLNLELKGAWEYQRDIQIKILDVTGRILATSVEDEAGTVHLDLNHLPAGVYVINIITNEGRIFTKRFERVN